MTTVNSDHILSRLTSPLAKNTNPLHKDDMTPLIELKKVCFSIGEQALVSDINLRIFPKDMISLIGPNGAGKSTLVKLILGLLAPTKGRIEQANEMMIGYVPQKFSVPSILPLRVVDLLAQARQNRLTDNQRDFLLEALSLSKLLNRQLIHLSGGETQRVLIARALLEKPDLLILDEPMQGLDPETEDLLYRFIDQLPEFLQCAMLVVSHDLNWVMKGSRHVICLNKHICCEGQPTDIHNSKAFQQLFGYEFATLLNNPKFEQPYIHDIHCQHITTDLPQPTNQIENR